MQEQKIINNKIGLLKQAETLGSVSQGCKVMGFSRGHGLSLGRRNESRAIPRRLTSHFARRPLYQSKNTLRISATGVSDFEEIIAE